jgi:hypothetical protein
MKDQVRIDTGMFMGAVTQGNKTTPIDNTEAAVRNLINRGFVKISDKTSDGRRCQIWERKGKNGQEKRNG